MRTRYHLSGKTLSLYFLALQAFEGSLSIGTMRRRKDDSASSASSPAYTRATSDAARSTGTTAVAAPARQLEELTTSCYYTSHCWFHGVMDRLPYSICSPFHPKVSPQSSFALSQVKSNYVAPYDTANNSHVELLGRLWSGHNRITFSSADELSFTAGSSVASERWKELGFQGVDPATDFRGAGVFGLRQLVYLIEAHPDQWNRFLTPNFMLSAAGINVSMWLQTLLGLNLSVSQYNEKIRVNYTSASAKAQLCKFICSSDDATVLNRLNEVFCFGMRLLHYRWTRSSQNLMEFNQRLLEVFAEMEQLFCVSSSLHSLCSII